MPAHFPNIAKSLTESERMQKKSAWVAEHKYRHTSFLYLNFGPTLIGLQHKAARMTHIMCKSFTSRLKWKKEAENGYACTKYLLTKAQNIVLRDTI